MAGRKRAMPDIPEWASSNDEAEETPEEKEERILEHKILQHKREIVEKVNGDASDAVRVVESATHAVEAVESDSTSNDPPTDEAASLARIRKVCSKIIGR